MANRQLRKSKWLSGYPEMEAVEAAMSNIGPAEAARETEFLRQQHRRVFLDEKGLPVELDAILETLQAKKIPFVLVGAHAIGTWTGRPRATHDVDILCKSGRNHARAVNAIKALYPHLEVRRFAGLTAFFIPGETMSVIDVTMPFRADNAETLRTAMWITRGPLRYRMPTLEAALANKYGAMVAITRDLIKRGQDAIDFAWMVKHA